LFAQELPGFNRNCPARVLPNLPDIVPMKAKLGQNSGDFCRLFLGELNPNPLANHFREFKKTRCLIAEQRQQFFGVQCPVYPAQFHVDFWSVSRACAQLFGTALSL